MDFMLMPRRRVLVQCFRTCCAFVRHLGLVIWWETFLLGRIRPALRPAAVRGVEGQRAEATVVN